MFKFLITTIKSIIEMEKVQSKLNVLMGRKEKSDYIRLKLHKRYIQMIELIARHGIDDSAQLLKVIENNVNRNNFMTRFSVSLVYQDIKNIMLRTLILNSKDEANALLETINYFKKETDGMGLILKSVTRIN